MGMGSWLAILLLLLQPAYNGLWCPDSSTTYSVSVNISGLIFKNTRRRHKQWHTIKWLLVVLLLSVEQNKYKVMKVVGE